MKPLIVGLALAILYTSFMIYQQDNNQFIRALEDLKYVADECSDSASLFYNTSQFGKGKKTFNQIEGKKAIKDILKKNLNLDDTLTPLPGGYWTETIEYDVYFFDDSNTTFPYLFTDPKTSYSKTLTEPTVIVTVNAGKPRFRLSFLNPSDAIRSSAYEYESSKF